MNLDSNLYEQGASYSDSIENPVKIAGDVTTSVSVEGRENSHQVKTGMELPIDTAHFANLLSTATIEITRSTAEAQHEGLNEFIQNQEIVLESLQNENAKFKSSEMLRSLDELMQKGKFYQTKLVRLKTNMIDIKNRTDNLKKTTEKLKLQKEKMVINQEEAHRREIERENLLVAKPVRVDNTQD